MTYEEYLDEVTTLITEKYDARDEDAIRYVMQAQADDFFTLHDDLPEMRTQQRAEQDAKAVFEKYGKPRASASSPRSKKKK